MFPIARSRGFSLTCQQILHLSRSGECASNILTLNEAARAARNIPKGSTPQYGNSAGESLSGSVVIDQRFSRTLNQPEQTENDTQQRPGTGLSTPASQSGPHSGTLHPEPKSRTFLAYPAQPFVTLSTQPEGPPPPMDELLAKALNFLTISPHTWRTFGTSQQPTCLAMRAKVYAKLRSLGMSYARVAEVCGHTLDHVRHGCRANTPREKNLKPGGRIKVKENAEASQSES